MFAFLLASAPLLSAQLSNQTLYRAYEPHPSPPHAPRAPSAARDKAKSDINHAPLAELENVPGLNPLWAQRIIAHRPYNTKQALVDKGILPAAVYDHARNFLIAHRETH